LCVALEERSDDMAVEIRHKETGAVLHQLAIDTLEGASLAGLYFCDADLAGVNLAGANLAGAIFRATDLRGADLTRANMRGTYLFQADLRGANLAEARMFIVSLDSADLTGANLTGADLTGSYLAEAKLKQTTLCYTNLQSTYLAHAELSGARMAFTLLADCPSLHLAAGLAEVEHLGPSALDLSTLRAGATTLPEAFLRGAGLGNAEIDALRALYARPSSHASCFLSATAADCDLAERLGADLRARGVSCWPFRSDLGAGYMVQVAFDQAMKRHDRWVILCSEHSLRQPDVAGQILAAIEREQETSTQKLFPVRVDDFMLSEELRRNVEEKVAAGEWRVDWARPLRERTPFDFRDWTTASSYQAAFELLLNALENPAPRRS
jgi:uncharacterized protein YjbI with pentapeptide repeats